METVECYKYKESAGGYGSKPPLLYIVVPSRNLKIRLHINEIIFFPESTVREDERKPHGAIPFNLTQGEVDGLMTLKKIKDDYQLTYRF